MAAHGIAAKWALTGIDSAGTHVMGQASYWEKTNGGPTTINTLTVALGLTAALTNLSIATAIANDCNTQYGTSYTSADVALADGMTLL